MAIDFLICFLLLISLAINLLALGAFWVTPGLRTTANRFVINLLIVNIFGCIALAPILFLNNHNGEKHSTEIVNNNPELTTTIEKNLEKFNTTVSSTIECNSVRCKAIFLESHRDTEDQVNERIIIAELDNNENINNNNNEVDENFDQFVDDEFNDSTSSRSTSKNNQNIENIDRTPPKRCWTLDTAAALGALSVLLVVGDTWCAVTDPLRYHSRISGLKAWVLIATTWFLGIFFGVLSALRETAFSGGGNFTPIFGYSLGSPTTPTIIDRTGNLNNNKPDAADDSQQSQNVKIHEELNEISADPTSLYASIHQSTVATISVIGIQPNELYNMIFSCIYFIIIILLPFGFVCGMYWRIFSEARENGLRMRQNGSSPLLQSALNLSGSPGVGQHTHSHHNHHSHQTHTEINNKNSNNNNLNSQMTTAAVNSNYNGLTMKIDHRRGSNCDNEKDISVRKPLLMPPANYHRQHRASFEDDHRRQQTIPETVIKQDRNQNILLTLSQAAGNLRRNSSARQLFLLDSSTDLNEAALKRGIRQTHSTPNLQKSSANHTAGNDGYITINVVDSTHHALQLPQVHVPPKALSYMTSIRHRLSNASSLFKYREESRAARISILVVIMFLISYLPYGLIVLLQGKDLVSHLLTTQSTTQLAIVMVLLANLSSPFIFAYRNKRVRRGVRRLFGLDFKTNRDHYLVHRNVGGLLRCGTKASINVRRSASKASTYSVNSCKYLTPHTVVSNGGGNGGTFIVEIEKCHYVKNGCQKNSIVPLDDKEQPNNFIIKETSLQQQKRSILKKVCDSSRKFGCASNSCANSDNEQTDV